MTLAAEPLNGSGWYAVMQLADEQRIDRIIALAEQELPLEAIAAGPAMTLGVGPEFAAENAVGFILQDLGKTRAFMNQALGRPGSPG